MASIWSFGNLVLKYEVTYTRREHPAREPRVGWGILGGVCLLWGRSTVKPGLLQENTNFRWTAQRERAAVLLADDEITDEAIAVDVGVHVSTLWRWRQNADFAAKIGEHVGRLQAGMLRYRVAKKRHRLKALDDLHTKALDTIQCRADRYQAMLGDDRETVAAQAAKSVIGGVVPGEAATGLLVEKESVNNTGYRTVEWSVDTGLMREIRAIHEQAAKELGQWVEKGEIEIGDGITREYIVVRTNPAVPQPTGFADLLDEDIL